MIQLSIIVPVYNVEKYLAKCLDSLLQQDLTPNEYEILVIDDESPDGSRAIAEQFAAEHEHIRVINQKNLGLGGARNTGITHARGKYLMFVDSDDYIEPNSIGKLIDITDKKGLEILRFGYVEEKEDLPVEINHTDEEARISDTYTGEEFIAERMRVGCYAWVLVIRTKLLMENNLYFVHHRYYEDTEWFPRVLLKTERIADCDKVVYHYLQRKGSITKATDMNKKGKIVEDKLLLIDHLQELEKSTNHIGAKDWFNMMLAHLVVSIVNFSITHLPVSVKEIKKKLLCKTDLFPLCGKRVSKPLKRKIRILNTSINAYIITRKIYYLLKWGL